MFADLKLNIWATDRSLLGTTGSADLLADFSTKRNFGVRGRLWIELKVMSSTGFGKKLQERQAQLQAKFLEVHKADATLEGVMIVAAKASRDGRIWQSPDLVAQLLVAGSSEWQTIAGKSPIKPLRGKAKCNTKPALQDCLDQTEWVTHPVTRQRVGYLNHFLVALGLPENSLSKRTPGFNTLLQQEGLTDRVTRVKLPHQPGQAPWLASREALRCLYRAL